MKVNQLLEKTMQSRPPAEVQAFIKRLAFKHLFGGDHGKEWYNMSDARHVMDFSEWQLARYERDFDVQIKDTDPRRISVDIDGIVELGERMGFVNRHDSRQERIRDAKKWLDQAIKPLGWFVFRVAAQNFQLDPVSQEAISVPDKVYHFTPAWNKNSILKKGILPKKGRYEDDYIYPPRVHVLLSYDESQMYDLAMHIFNWGRSTESVYHSGMNAAPPLAIFEIDTSRLNKGTRFYHDISVNGGAWTYTHIPPSAIKLVHEDEYEEDEDKY